MFRCVAQTTRELASDPKYLGAAIGLTAVLHTWGQNLSFHPHIHCIVPAGGLNKLGKWVDSKKKFFLPVKALSGKFRGKFLYYLKQAYSKGELKFYGKQEYLLKGLNFLNLLSPLYQKEWVVYCKPPFKNASCVVSYLGRYTHRVAISNNRILKLKNGQVTFKWRDYRDNNKEKIMTITAEEFIRRFLMHILPNKFVKIRHYGILSNRNRKTKLKLCKKHTGMIYKMKAVSFKKLSAAELFKKLTGIDYGICPCCNKGKMSTKLNFKPFST
jgi:hypothetical protein